MFIVQNGISLSQNVQTVIYTRHFRSFESFLVKHAHFNRKSAIFGLQIGSFRSRSFPDRWSRERRLWERDCVHLIKKALHRACRPSKLTGKSQSSSFCFPQQYITGHRFTPFLHRKLTEPWRERPFNFSQSVFGIQNLDAPFKTQSHASRLFFQSPAPSPWRAC